MTKMISATSENSITGINDEMISATPENSSTGVNGGVNELTCMRQLITKGSAQIHVIP